MTERMCVACGRMTTAQRHETRPDCGTLDLTAEEAWDHWRQVAYALREGLASLRRGYAPTAPRPPAATLTRKNLRWGWSRGTGCRKRALSHE